MPNRRNVYFFYKPEEKYEQKVQSIFQLAKQYDFTIVNDYRKANIIVAIGGDGTFLQAVHKTGFKDDCLYAGIATGETLSFYCDFHIDDTEKIVEAITSEQIEVRRYPFINVTIDGNTKFQCLNECTVRSGIIKTFVVEVFIDDLHFETFRGDGMIVSTPTGSTAYNKSVRGAVVDPMLSSIQVSELASLNNNHYRTLGSPFILSGERKLTLEVVQDGNDYPVIGLDNEALGIRNVQKLEISLSDTKIKTVKLKDNSFWEKVRRTFL
ncbi:NAD kinase [Sutcliffiella cohnii]|uniref:NAD kinase n=1 Tax=Sutcliffiella cohnii TaxID=33932 RepID=A0A223KU11_9BACI|nr:MULTISPECIES: NAD kinase [Sutcliffiella]AST92857.1 NAD kinase [Sutcliffiella cohnii]MED4016188.1 NAD kinase [Sutcliffiella cohnii]WBL14115.1 NAD kinase [Sutcliffiella sp. NC1]